jgi:hypothetical protein
MCVACPVEVLSVMAVGVSNVEIAERLVSPAS